MKLAIVSDLHAYKGPKDPAPSLLDYSAPESDVRNHPIAGLIDLIERESLACDYLVCPGDLADRADPAGQAYVWNRLNHLKVVLSSRSLVATAGNHDLNSRFQGGGYDAKGTLQGLEPPFPIDAESSFNEYWAKNFTTIEDGPSRIVILNSSAYHGYNDEHEHGRVSSRTIAWLTRYLDSKPSFALNIIVTHHNPLQHSEHGLGEHDVMRGGQDLTDLLGSGKYGDWLLIHGHKHHAKIHRAAGGLGAPIIFSAASLCASIYDRLKAHSANQFYIVDIDPRVVEERGLVGRFTAWDWCAGEGWLPSSGGGLPYKGGFGHAEKLPSLIRKCKTVITGPNHAFDAIVSKVPELLYLAPDDLRNLLSMLEPQGIGISYDENRLIKSIGVVS